MRFTSLFLVIVVLLTLAFTAAAQEAHTVFRHGGSVQTVAYSPVNPSLFASAGDRGAIKVWNLHNDTVTTLGRHADTVNSVAFSPDGNFLASGGDDYVLKVWNVHHKHHIATCEQITDRTRSQVKAVTFSPNGSTIATGGRHAKLWDARTYNEAGTYHSKSRAAYWDGRNEHGERVASGVYFYTLSAGDFTATRKMFIRK